MYYIQFDETAKTCMVFTTNEQGNPDYPVQTWITPTDTTRCFAVHTARLDVAETLGRIIKSMMCRHENIRPIDIASPARRVREVMYFV